MGYNKENFKRIRNEYATKHLVAESAARLRTSEIHGIVPEIMDIDRALASTGVSLMSASLLPAKERDKRFEQIKAKNLELNCKREEILVAAGYPADYDAVKYDCPKCGDSGYVGIQMCECMRKALIMAGFESSGISHLLKKQTFENFSLDYYKSDESVYRKMAKMLDVTRAYAEGFTPEAADNLAFFGGTGLGKTHISSAIARTVIEKGYDVLYVSAIELVSAFESEQFGKDIARGELTDKFFDCDLLIIDDLGTEIGGQFTQSTIYNVLNIRINKKMPTIISTNCKQDELLKKYSERVASRIFGEFRPLLFLGIDVRMQKIKQ